MYYLYTILQHLESFLKYNDYTVPRPAPMSVSGLARLRQIGARAEGEWARAREVIRNAYKAQPLWMCVPKVIFLKEV